MRGEYPDERADIKAMSYTIFAHQNGTINSSYLPHALLNGVAMRHSTLTQTVYGSI
jgi:hypothetical protein